MRREHDSRVDGIRASHPLWIVYRVEEDSDGRTDGVVDCGSFWTEAEAVTERDRLQTATTEERLTYEVIENVATVVYPADEPPPWVADPDRLKRRGYEQPNW